MTAVKYLFIVLFGLATRNQRVSDSPESVKGNDAFVRHVSTRHQLHHVQRLLEILDGAQPLQTLVLDVDALVELDFLQMFQTVWREGKGRESHVTHHDW